jgi:3-oxo-5-alpha-steroid 4-dehydrogenase 1
MMEYSFFQILLIVWTLLAFLVFVLLFFVPAPYGKTLRKGWGPTLPSRLGWMLMEAPAFLGMLFWFILGEYLLRPVSIVFFILWQVHYVHRAFVYPFLIRDKDKPMPLLVVVMAIFFNLVNTYLNGRFLFQFSGGYPVSWIGDVRFLIGIGFFIAGFVINQKADSGLRKLRGVSPNEYYIPNGRMYRWISCPNYFGEIIEWTGWALATWSVSGLSFALWTIANLVPRARSYHRWYLNRFPEYPKERKILIPKIW